MKGLLGYGTVALVLVGVASMRGAAHGKDITSVQALKPVAASNGNAENGKRIYNKDGCYECHGVQGQGTPVTGPRLGPDPVPFEFFVSYVRKPARNMPPFTEKVLSDKDLADIYAFLQSLPHPPAEKTIPILQY
jgi:mono/diheme cytochrome c family protein